MLWGDFFYFYSDFVCISLANRHFEARKRIFKAFLISTLQLYFFMKKIVIDTASPQPPQARILMIYTGGTLGMAYDATGSYLVPFDFEQIQQRLPELKRLNLEITVLTLEPLIDSANVLPEHWLALAKLIEAHYEDYTGFVILHGTDTMAYTASALSFLLENLAKPVILTGAQLPIGEPRNDARVNLITSLQMAAAQENGHALVPEVCIYFDYFLWRGNRARKVESSHFDAFSSQNYPHLAEVGIDIYYNRSAILPLPEAAFRVHGQLGGRVSVLKLFPGLQAATMESMLFGGAPQAVVLETYGSGTAPTGTWFLDLLRQARQKGIVLMNVSQCYGGRVQQGSYETSKHLAEIGIVSGLDISTEAAVTKLMFLLAQEHTEAYLQRLLGTSLRGEMSG